MPEIKKGNNSANNVSGVTSFNLCKMAGHALHCTKFRDWLVGCFGLNGPLRQYFSLYQAVSQREGERKEK